MKLLSQAEILKEYKIDSIDGCDESVKNHLINLGFLRGEKIVVLKKNFGKKSLLVKVMNINYAIDKIICDSIIIYE